MLRAGEPDHSCRVLILVAIALLLILPAPWDFVGFGVAFALGLVEIFFWHRTVRGRKRVVGAQTLIGRQAVVVSACRPTGRVRIGAETWSAESEREAAAGAVVEIIGVRGLLLLVTPVATEASRTSASSSPLPPGAT
jgi:membrane protein implicated in regulation of membrane protease activity